MDSSIVTISNGVPVTSTYHVAISFGREHSKVVQIFNKYIDKFVGLQDSNINHSVIHKKTPGRPVESYPLNCSQTMFLCSLFRNTAATVGVKADLAGLFAKAETTMRSVRTAIEKFDFGDTDVRFVYAASDKDGNLKIGISNNPERRVAELNTGNPCKLELVYTKESNGNGYESESLIHRSARHNHIRGEWYTSDAKKYLT